MASNPQDVVCFGDGLKFGYIDRPITANIDTRQAGPGELTVFCNTLDNAGRNAFCELKDHEDGFFTLTIRARDVGIHELYVKYDGIDVRGSPFTLRVSPASKVYLSGEGLKDGILGENQAEFVANTKDVGQGHLKLRVGGPRGSFRIETRRVEDGLVLCTYSPRHTGVYVVNVMWDEDHIPGSPFQVYWCRTPQELDRYRAMQSTA